MTGKPSLAWLAVPFVAGTCLAIWPKTHAQQETTKQGAIQASSRPNDLAELLESEPEVNVQAMIDDLKLRLEELARRRVEIAEQMTRLSVLQMLSPPSPSGSRGTFMDGLRNYGEWSIRRMEGRMELAEGQEERLKLLAQEVVRLRELERFYRQRAAQESLTITPINLMEIEYLRLEVEARLVKGAAEGL